MSAPNDDCITLAGLPSDIIRVIMKSDTDWTETIRLVSFSEEFTFYITLPILRFFIIRRFAFKSFQPCRFHLAGTPMPLLTSVLLR